MTAAVLELLLGVVVLQNVAVLRAPLVATLARYWPERGRHAGARVRMRASRYIRHAHRRLPRTARHAGQPAAAAA